VVLVGVEMSYRVIHHCGDKDLLIEKLKEIADELKNNEYKDDFDFDEGEWERAVDSVVNGDFSDRGLASLVLHLAINTSFPAISEDCGISFYEALADRTSGKLAKTLRMFVDGRNFSTGNSGFGFGDEINCGYLTSDEVREFLELLKAYTPDSTDEDEKEFVDILIDTFSELVEKNSGDLFVMS
jgi:hypothetical protein